MFDTCTRREMLKSLGGLYNIVNYILPVLLTLILAAGTAPALAHTTVRVGDYDIEAGWQIEPPVVGFRNAYVFEISVPGEVEGVKKGVRNAFSDMDVTVKYGGATKKLVINSETSPGHYFSNVIPTRTGSMSVLVQGDLEGTPVDIEIPVEDVETTAILDFPPRSGSSDTDAEAVKAALSSIQQDVSVLKSKLGSVDNVEEIDAGPAYDFAIFGLSLGAAGTVLAVVAMTKRK
ncbi:hypothetical protein CENSYa_1797 [Cenarchaeum symbiosum A]|uniref:Uncharacterized protein n=1 Tax=Cenarchaeum symbiosum (strain A) TaxID=414004 RepID=A0RYJ0_CENSY|nr:hypothetical protein CENSYa_1797 [Cenarchaeum symbiosum A]